MEHGATVTVEDHRKLSGNLSKIAKTGTLKLNPGEKSRRADSSKAIVKHINIEERSAEESLSEDGQIMSNQSRLEAQSMKSKFGGESFAFDSVNK